MANENIKKFLDQDGVSLLWSKVVENITAEADRAKAAEKVNADAIAAEAARAALAESANAEAAAAAQKTADDLADLVGNIPTDENGDAIAATVIAYVDKKTEGIATDAALAELQATVNTINGDYLKDADKTELSNAIAAEVERATAAEQANADAIAAVDTALKLAVDNNTEGMDSIKELATWINEHGNDAAGYARAIAALEAKTVLGTDTDGEEYATVKAYVEAIEAATKSYADGLASNYDAAGSASAAEAAAKSYADGLASNYDEAGAAAGALTSANAYTDSAIANIQVLSEEDILAIIEPKVEG